MEEAGIRPLHGYSTLDFLLSTLIDAMQDLLHAAPLMLTMLQFGTHTKVLPIALCVLVAVPFVILFNTLAAVFLAEHASEAGRQNH